MVARRFVNEFGEREDIDQVFLVLEKQMRANRQGNLYLQMRLGDRSGSLTAMLWNANEQLYASFDAGDYLQVKGRTQYHNGALQMIANRIDSIEPTQIDEADFLVMSSGELDRLGGRLQQLLQGITDPALRNLADCFLLDEDFVTRFSRAPAGIKLHHAFPGGLLQHVVQLMELVDVIAPLYPQIQRDMLMMGAFLHDIGKVDELRYDRELSYSDAGQLLGHVVLGVELLEAKIAEAERLSGEAFTADYRLRLKHMVLSHHGQYEFGSPKVPMTLEAMALHYLDTLDSKIHTAEQVMREDPNTDSAWTNYQPGLGRKFYKGMSGPEPSETSTS